MSARTVVNSCLLSGTNWRRIFKVSWCFRGIDSVQFEFCSTQVLQCWSLHAKKTSHLSPSTDLRHPAYTPTLRRPVPNYPSVISPRMATCSTSHYRVTVAAAPGNNVAAASSECRRSRRLELNAADRRTVGHISSETTIASGGMGTSDCPFVIRAAAGQKIRWISTSILILPTVR